MHSLSTILALFAVAASLAAAFFAWRARRYAASCYEWVRKNNATDLGIKQLTDIEVELTEHRDSIAALHKSLHKLRSRIHMRKVNSGADDGVPDPAKDPEGWKRHMNAQLAQKGRP